MDQIAVQEEKHHQNMFARRKNQQGNQLNLLNFSKNNSMKQKSQVIFNIYLKFFVRFFKNYSKRASITRRIAKYVWNVIKNRNFCLNFLFILVIFQVLLIIRCIKIFDKHKLL